MRRRRSLPLPDLRTSLLSLVAFVRTCCFECSLQVLQAENAEADKESRNQVQKGNLQFCFKTHGNFVVHFYDYFQHEKFPLLVSELMPAVHHPINFELTFGDFAPAFTALLDVSFGIISRNLSGTNRLKHIYESTFALVPCSIISNSQLDPQP